MLYVFLGLMCGFIAWMVAMFVWFSIEWVFAKYAFIQSKGFREFGNYATLIFTIFCAFAGGAFMQRADSAKEMERERRMASHVTEIIVVEGIEQIGQFRLLKTPDHPERLAVRFYSDIHQDELVVGGRYEIRREKSLIHSHKRLPDVSANAEDEAPPEGSL